MALPLKYNVRNLRVRWVTTLMTIAGIGLVTFIFVTIFALGIGLERTLTGTGHPRNMIVLRKNATETQSLISRDQAADIENSFEGVEKDSDGNPMVSRELLALANLSKADGKRANIALRGVGPMARRVRDGITIVEGRWFEPSLGELVVGRAARDRFSGIHVGDTPTFRGRQWKIVGVFDANGQAYESEVWGHIDDLQAQFKKDYSTLIVRCRDTATIERLGHLIESDKKLQLEGKPHAKYYEDQNNGVVMIKVLAIFMGVVLAVGAVFGAANTMYAAVAARNKEIATIRFLGFGRGSVWFTFTLEAAFMGLIGGVAGGALSFLAFNGMKTGTANWDTFSEIAFQFRVTPLLIGVGTVLAVIMAVVGGFLPAWRASRTTIAHALRGM